MKKEYWFYAIIISLIIFATTETVKAIDLGKKLKFTQEQLEDTENELTEANDKIDELKEQVLILSNVSSSGRCVISLSCIRTYSATSSIA
jgi:peptidoglycan hydrolase CwlO-like protein